MSSMREGFWYDSAGRVLLIRQRAADDSVLVVAQIDGHDMSHPTWFNPGDVPPMGWSLIRPLEAQPGAPDEAKRLASAEEIVRKMVEDRTAGNFWIGDHRESLVLHHWEGDMPQGLEAVRRIIARLIERSRAEGAQQAALDASELAPRMYPVTAGPLQRLWDRIAYVLIEVYDREEERAGPTAARILQMVDAFVHGQGGSKAAGAAARSAVIFGKGKAAGFYATCDRCGASPPGSVWCVARQAQINERCPKCGAVGVADDEEELQRWRIMSSRAGQDRIAEASARQAAQHPGDGVPVSAEPCATCGGSGEVNYENYEGPHDCLACSPPSAPAPAAAPAEATPWRGLEHEVAELTTGGTTVAWLVSAGPHGAKFYGPHAEARAREYAAWVSSAPAPEKATAAPVSGDDRGTPSTRGGRATESMQPAEPSVNAAPAIRVALGQRWRRKASGAVWTVVNLTVGGTHAALAPPGDPIGASMDVRVADLLAGDVWELVPGPTPSGTDRPDPNDPAGLRSETAPASITPDEVARAMVNVGDFPGTRGFVVSIDDETSGLSLDTSEVLDREDLDGLAEEARSFMSRVIARARNEGAAAARSQPTPPSSPAAHDREALGRAAWSAYMDGAYPWESLTERAQRSWCDVGERLFAMGVEAARASAGASEKLGRLTHDVLDRIERDRGAMLDKAIAAAGKDVQSLTCGGVTITGPRSMTLGEMWEAIKASPALRVCLDAELRREREGARALPPEAVEAARRDVQTAVLEDAFRAGVEEGERRARAAAQRPSALAAGQRWRDQSGTELRMQEHVPTGLLVAIGPRGQVDSFRPGEAAPSGWTLVADVPTAPPTSNVGVDSAGGGVPQAGAATPGEMIGAVAKIHAKLQVIGGLLSAAGMPSEDPAKLIAGAMRLNVEALQLLAELHDGGRERAQELAERWRGRAKDRPGNTAAAYRKCAAELSEAFGLDPEGAAHEPVMPMRAGVWRDERNFRVVARNCGESVEAAMSNGTLRWFDAGDPAPSGWTFAGEHQPQATGWWAMAPRRRALLLDWMSRQLPDLPMSGVDAIEVAVDARAWLTAGAPRWLTRGEERRRAFVTWLEMQRPVIPGEASPEDLVGAACDLLRGTTVDAAQDGSAEIHDPRWQPGAVWEHRSVDVARFEIVRGEPDADGRIFLRGPWGDVLAKPAALSEANGWRFVGNPAPGHSPGSERA